MKIILILSILIVLGACSKEPSKELIETSIKKSIKYDTQFWKLSHVTVVDKIKNSSFDSEVSFCEDIKATFKLTLIKSCYLNNGSILENNVVVSWIKLLVKIDALAVKVYEEDVCINGEDVQKELDEDISEINRQIGQKKCYDLVQTGMCQLEKVYSKENAAEDVDILKKQVDYSLRQMKQYKKDYSENLTTEFRLCKMKNDTWEYWEKL
jgi:hypothetical protein